MTTGIVVDEEGNEAAGVLRSNRIVSFTVGRMTRHISLDDFAELGLIWKVNKSNDDAQLAYREPIDSLRFFRITGEGLN